jgi:hypothetical protein
VAAGGGGLRAKPAAGSGMVHSVEIGLEYRIFAGPGISQVLGEDDDSLISANAEDSASSTNVDIPVNLNEIDQVARERGCGGKRGAGGEEMYWRGKIWLNACEELAHACLRGKSVLTFRHTGSQNLRILKKITAISEVQLTRQLISQLFV